MKIKFKILLMLLSVNIAYANVNVVVSILPQQTFVEKIGGDKVDVTTMVKPGNSPHTYEPKPSQMKDIAKADIYFSIGVEFEESWLAKFSNQNKKMKIVDLSTGIAKMEMLEHHHDENAHEEQHGDHHHDGLDPHIWTSPANVKLMAKNILFALVSKDAQNKAYYMANYNKFMNHISDTDKKINKILANTKTGTKFMVFHPSWGYFAAYYGLTQLAIEIEGKEPKPRALESIIKKARKEKIKAIFVQKEFSDKSAKVLATELNIKVIKITPLAKEWSKNLINIAEAIANNH